MTDVKHVYILGAGFSVALGGPLFNELLTVPMSRRYLHKFTELDPVLEQGFLQDDVRVLQLLPNAIREVLTQSESNANAEEILESLENLNNRCRNWLSDELCKKININLMSMQVSSGRNTLQFDNAAVYRLLKLRIVLETSWFLEDLHEDSDRWTPYRRWFDSLGSNDTIVTTNYDLIPEVLYERRYGTEKIEWGSKINGPLLCKLHGSCNWTLSNGKLVKSAFVDLSDMISRDFLIGMPGIGKSKLATGVLASEWTMAKEKILGAEVISIVGYSLPETDNSLRMMLLDAIAANKELKQVWIVLGGRSERGFRAKSIIENANRKVSVELLSEYAQDHLPARRPKWDERHENLVY